MLFIVLLKKMDDSSKFDDKAQELEVCVLFFSVNQLNIFQDYCYLKLID